MKKQSLKPIQLNALTLLAAGTPACHVAKQLEVAPMTIYRWQRLPEFESKLNSLTQAGWEELAKRLNVLSITAVETLQEILCDLSSPASVRVRAALGVLNMMNTANAALERGLQHRVPDFPPRGTGMLPSLPIMLLVTPSPGLPRPFLPK